MVESPHRSGCAASPGRGAFGSRAPSGWLMPTAQQVHPDGNRHLHTPQPKRDAHVRSFLMRSRPALLRDSALLWFPPCLPPYGQGCYLHRKTCVKKYVLCTLIVTRSVCAVRSLTDGWILCSPSTCYNRRARGSLYTTPLPCSITLFGRRAGRDAYSPLRPAHRAPSLQLRISAQLGRPIDVRHATERYQNENCSVLPHRVRGSAGCVCL